MDSLINVLKEIYYKLIKQNQSKNNMDHDQESAKTTIQNLLSQVKE